MTFVKKTWTDRIAEYITRRKLTNVSTGATEIVTVERSEGEISQEGDAFSATNMNDLEQRIADEFSELNSSITAKSLVNTYYDSSDDKLYKVNSDGTKGKEIKMGNVKIKRYTETASVGATNYATLTYTFDEPIDMDKTLVYIQGATLEYNATQGYIMPVQPSIREITSTGCTVQVANASSTARNCKCTICLVIND